MNAHDHDEQILLVRALGQIEERVANLVGEVANFRSETRTAHRALLNRMSSLERREAERNGTIVELAQWRVRAEQQMGEHLEASADRSNRLSMVEARHVREDAKQDGALEERTKWEKRVDWIRKEAIRGAIWLGGALAIAAWRLFS